jgi:hypothetical protein
MLTTRSRRRLKKRIRFVDDHSVIDSGAYAMDGSTGGQQAHSSRGTVI